MTGGGNCEGGERGGEEWELIVSEGFAWSAREERGERKKSGVGDGNGGAKEAENSGYSRVEAQPRFIFRDDPS